METAITGTLDTIAYDLGQFLFRVNPELSFEELADVTRKFIFSFNVRLNMDPARYPNPERDSFFINVGRGYHEA